MDDLKKLEEKMCGKNVNLLSRTRTADGKHVEVWSKCLRDKGHDEPCMDVAISKRAPVAQEE